MGIYLNPDNAAFTMDINDEIYVDKTELISYTNKKIDTRSRYFCVSRPRRFGKSMAANMLCAYYSKGCNSKKLFQQYKISQESDFEKHLNQYDVIYINVQQFLTGKDQLENYIEQIQRKVQKDLIEVYGESIEPETDRLSEACNQICQNKQNKCEGFIFIIDEWDCVFREAKGSVEVQKEYLEFLKDLFKDRTYVRMAYMTGILPIKKYGTHSALNIFDEYSMADPDGLEEFVGFTEKEVRELCASFGVGFDNLMKWYNGYRFGEISVYNPKSVVEAVRRKKIKNYWTQTETYEALRDYISMNFDGLMDSVIAMLEGGRIKINTRSFQNDMTTFRTKDDVLTLLIHLGYLAYDIENAEVYIPNKEIKEEFEISTQDETWQPLIEKFKRSEELLDATLMKKHKVVEAIIQDIHLQDASVIQFNNENTLASILNVAYYSAAKYYYAPVREMPTGKGFADLVYIPRNGNDKPVLLIELKWNKDAKTAIKQIKDRKYIKSLQEFAGEILLVGINYDMHDKTYECVIENAEWRHL